MSKLLRLSQPSLLSFIALLCASLIYAAYVVVTRLFQHTIHAAHLPQHGLLHISTAVIAISVIYCLLLILFFVKPKPKTPIVAYFGCNKITLKQLLFWSGVILVFEFVSSFFYHKLGISMSAWWVPTLRSTTTSHIIWLTSVLLLAPIFEELLFRGALFTGIAQSKLGTGLAVLITSYLWTLPLAQHNAFATISIFTMGILLAVARAKTKSVYTPIIMHFLNNFVDVILIITVFAH